MMEWKASDVVGQMLVTRGNVYKDTTKIASRALAALNEMSDFNRQGMSYKCMAIFDAAMVRLVQFSVSGYSSVESLLNFAGYMDLLSEATIPAPEIPHRAYNVVMSKEDIINELIARRASGAAKYGEVFRMVDGIISEFEPEGCPFSNYRGMLIWNNFELLLTKLCRFYNSGFKHRDSLVDLLGYVAIIGNIITEVEE